MVGTDGTLVDHIYLVVVVYAVFKDVEVVGAIGIRVVGSIPTNGGVEGEGGCMFQQTVEVGGGGELQVGAKRGGYVGFRVVVR